MLLVAGREESGGLPSLLESDGYIPLRYRTYVDGLPDAGQPRRIQLGIRRDFVEISRTGHERETSRGQLLELIVPSNSTTLRGFTVTTLNRWTYKPLSGTASPESGLPILDLHDGGWFNGTKPRIVLSIDFAAYANDMFIEIQFDGHSSFDLSYKHGDMYFLIDKGRLAGIRAEAISKQQLQNFLSFPRRSPHTLAN